MSGRQLEAGDVRHGQLHAYVDERTGNFRQQIYVCAVSVSVALVSIALAGFLVVVEDVGSAVLRQEEHLFPPYCSL
jgi:hypothetical protein